MNYTCTRSQAQHTKSGPALVSEWNAEIASSTDTPASLAQHTVFVSFFPMLWCEVLFFALYNFPFFFYAQFARVFNGSLLCHMQFICLLPAHCLLTIYLCHLPEHCLLRCFKGSCNLSVLPADISEALFCAFCNLSVACLHTVCSGVSEALFCALCNLPVSCLHTVC